MQPPHRDKKPSLIPVLIRVMIADISNDIMPDI